MYKVKLILRPILKRVAWLTCNPFLVKVTIYSNTCTKYLQGSNMGEKWIGADSAAKEKGIEHMLQEL